MADEVCKVLTGVLLNVFENFCTPPAVRFAVRK